MITILTVELRGEHDVVLARQRARQVAAQLDFDTQDQTRLSTAISELARNVVQYARAGRVLFLLGAVEQTPELVVRVEDRGPGIPHVDSVLRGEYRSTTGMGVGLLGARRLSDRFELRTAPGEGTTVELARWLPAAAAARARADARAVVARVVARLGAEPPAGSHQELLLQNQELLRSLAELRARQEEIERLNRELDETNRGVLALYAELDRRAEELQRASQLKTSFLSNVSHELRTPLSSILNIARLLVDASGGEFTPEHRKMAGYIRTSAQSLYEIVNDLLDIAKIEAGKVEVRPSAFTVEELFKALRGMFRPLVTNDAVTLVFDEPLDLPPLETDETKVAQILRNFVSNAVKYTERGIVRVSAERVDDDHLVFRVSDTGIGIAPEHQALVFEEFEQVENPLQSRHKGTGLGLPLTRQLARLLGGTVSLESELGAGSTFSVVIPRVYAGPAEPTLPRREVSRV
ncbi:MAG TPA: ATP-binding protein [Gemmatimonadaceae bacterium]|nr:ATP-binding protein [Gemmatimonadaceae bacterium]